jgi:hypothetical protein
MQEPACKIGHKNEEALEDESIHKKKMTCLNGALM